MSLDASPARRPRAGRPPAVAEPRERILDAAAKLFSRCGYESSSIADLAAAVGVSKAAIYHYYATKQDIYDAIILNVLAGLTDEVSQAVAQATTAHARLRQFMVTHARYFEAHHPQFVTMLISYTAMSVPDQKDAAYLRDGYEQLLRDIITDGVAQGEFRRFDVAATGRAVLSMLNWMARWYQPGGTDTAEVIAEGYFDLISGGMNA
jgi:AcrR family transcriptional regulator